MKAPDKIYTDNRGVYAKLPIFPQIDANVEYIRKDALLEWLRKTEDEALNEVPMLDVLTLQKVIDKLNKM